MDGLRKVVNAGNLPEISISRPRAIESDESLPRST